ncbi:MAG TPA: UDP-N-acetylmuramoyl-L-alanine--D-glutamate ligase [Solirubrobacteraceae bacterium]|nr:UDP-N-acetylmuramoyl-L-alanine--D-glutamate ligase [Solirubrobacteraceae bacterium]
MRPRPPIPTGPYLIVGLARSGVAAARVLHARGERVIGVDAGAPRQARELAHEGAAEPAGPGIELHLREDGLAQLERAGAVVKSPGVPAQTSVIAAARARGIPVLGELELAWRLLPNDFIAVTGTNGKTTTVELIGHIHRQAGLPVAVAGNVGTALSSLVGTIDARATVVCEVSSFQLEDAPAFAPEVAVLLNITPDHLDRHGTLEAYRGAKLRIFAHQRAGDVAVLPEALAEIELPPEVRRMCFDADPRPDIAHPRLRGEHNHQNAMAAAAVCLARGIDPDAVSEGLRTFAGVPHRLREVGSRNGALYVNDSKATNVASTLVALRAFPEGGVHLILGGQGKGQDFAPLRAAVGASCRAVYAIGEDAPRIAAALEGETAREGATVPLHECGDLERAVAAASAAARPGETVLLSPACASFDQFADFEARGARFAALVEKMV